MTSIVANYPLSVGVHFQVTSRLDLNGLLDVDRIPGNDKVGVSMKFSHVHKDRQHREYLFDDEDQCQVNNVIQTIDKSC